MSSRALRLTPAKLIPMVETLSLFDEFGFIKVFHTPGAGKDIGEVTKAEGAIPIIGYNSFIGIKSGDLR